jgi:hypothetical protein
MAVITSLPGGFPSVPSVPAPADEPQTALVQGHLMRLHDFRGDQVISPALAQWGVFEPL